MLKIKTKVIFSLAGMFSVTAAVVPQILTGNTSAAGCSESPCETTFQVNVKEALLVTLDVPQDWASGDTGNFLRNKVSLSVSSNNASGFTASMHSKDNTNLTNASNGNKTIQTLSNEPVCTSAACSAFPDNRWGYSLNDGSYTGTYRAMSTSAITLISAPSGTVTGSQDIYFGAKANASQASGTYTGTVVIDVVAGTIDPGTNPIIPTSPAVNTDTVAANVATYDATADRTVYYSTSTTPGGGGTPSTRTTATRVSEGDATDAYQSPAGVSKTITNKPSISTNSNITENGSPLANGLAITAAAAAAAGAGFFILAKRRDDDDEEEQQQQ